MEETKSTAPPLVSFSRHSQTYCVYVTVSLTPPSTVKPGCSTALVTTTIVISWSSSSSCGWVPVMSSTVAGRGCLCYWTYSLWVKWISSDSHKYHNISAIHSCTGILEQSDWYIWDGKSSFFHHCLLCIPVCVHTWQSQPTSTWHCPTCTWHCRTCTCTWHCCTCTRTWHCRTCTHVGTWCVGLH